MNNTTEDTWTTGKPEQHSTAEMTTSNRTTHLVSDKIPASSPDNNGDGGGWKPSQWPTAAVLGGIVFLVLLGIVVVLVYRRKRQSKYRRRTKKSEEEVGFMDAETENRRSDIAMQLLQVTDPSYFEIEEAAQNAKLKELQDQEDLNIMEIINASDAKENGIQDEKCVVDTGPNNSQHNQNSVGLHKENQDTRSSNISVQGGPSNEHTVAESSNISATDSPSSENSVAKSSLISATESPANEKKYSRSSNISVASSHSAKVNKEKRSNSMRMSSSVRNSNTEGDKQCESKKVVDSKQDESKPETEENNSTVENGVEQRLKQRQSARSSDGAPKDKRTSDKLNNTKSSTHSVGGVVASEVTRPTSVRSSKHSSAGYDEAVKQMKHVDSDPNLSEEHSIK